MYNKEQKERFLDAINIANGNRSWAIGVFNTIENMETETGRDLAMLSPEEVGTALLSSGARSYVTIANRLPLVVRYKNWCAENGIDAVTMLSSEIVFDLSVNIKQTMVCTPKQLDRILHEAFPDRKGMSTMAPAYRAYMWFAFSGMFEEDAVQVRMRDINLQDRLVYVSNRWYGLEPESIPEIKAASKFTTLDREMADGSIRHYRREEGDVILRGRKLEKSISPKDYVKKTLRPLIQSYMKEIGRVDFTFQKVRRSGLFYETFRREVRGLAPNFYTIAVDDYERDNHKPVTESIRKRTISRGNLNYERDYSAWKRAFEQELKEEFGLETIR